MNAATKGVLYGQDGPVCEVLGQGLESVLELLAWDWMAIWKGSQNGPLRVCTRIALICRSQALSRKTVLHSMCKNMRITS